MTSAIRAAMVGWGSLLLAAGGWTESVSAAEEPVDAPATAVQVNRPLERASEFAPAGVLLDHTHERGEWTFLYNYERYSLEGLMSGDQSVSNQQVADRYAVVPRSQLRQTHTFGMMYAPRDRFTVAFLLPYVDFSLDQSVNGVRETQSTNGIGDARLVVMIPFIQKEFEATQFNVQLSFPTGSIQVKGKDGQRLPYIMQRGTGTWDVHYGITYLGHRGIMSWGGQLSGVYRLNENNLGYRLGGAYGASAWLAGELGPWISVSGRFVWARSENIHGSDPELERTKAENPLNDNMKQAGTLLEAGPGVNILLPVLGGQRLSVEVLFPIYQDLDGPQLASDLKVTAGWQWIF